MQRIRRTAAALALSSVVLLLAACSEDEPGSKAAEEPTAVETTPVAEQETPEEFIRRWFKASKQMQNTGETSEYLELAENCSPCKQIADDIEAIYAAGGEVRFQGDQIKSVGRYGKAQDRYLVKAQVLPTAYETASGAPTETFPGGAEQFVVTLRTQGSSWQVVDLHALAS